MFTSILRAAAFLCTKCCYHIIKCLLAFILHLTELQMFRKGNFVTTSSAFCHLPTIYFITLIVSLTIHLATSLLGLGETMAPPPKVSSSM